MAEYLHYWAPERVRLAFEGRERSLRTVASGWYRTLQNNDILWLLARDRDENPRIIARLELQGMPRQLKKPPAYAVGNSRFFKNYEIDVKAGAKLRSAPLPWATIRKLRFDSKSADRLKSTGLIAFAEGLASIRRLTPRSVELLQSAWGAEGTASENTSKSALWGDPESNKRTEIAAIAHVTTTLTSQGWSVVSVESESCGYDLQCRKGKAEKHIEVKGRGGNDRSFQLTRNEFEQSKIDPLFEFWIVSGLTAGAPHVSRFRGSELTKRYALVPLSYLVVPSKG